jgi:hypothetical protein
LDNREAVAGAAKVGIGSKGVGSYDLTFFLLNMIAIGFSETSETVEKAFKIRKSTACTAIVGIPNL